MISCKVECENYNDDIVIMKLDGYIDFSAKEILIPHFRKALDDKRYKILINFKNVKKINSMGIAVILEIIDEIIEVGGEIRYSNLNRINRKLFNMIGLTEYGEIFPSDEEALIDF